MDAQPDDPTGHDPSTPPTPPRGAARGLLLVAGVVVSAEALGLIALGVTEATLIDPGRAGLGISTALFLGFFGVLLLVGVARVLKGEAWARGLLVFSQLIQLLLSYNFRGDVWWIPTALAVSALLALGCLLSPPVTRALNADPGM